MDPITILKDLYKTKDFSIWKENIKYQISEKLNTKGITSIDLCLSALCGANCIFCPKTRNKDVAIKNMTIETAKSIAEEVASDKFREDHNVKRFGVGGQGDALLNPNFIEILRYLKQSNPNIPITLNTNFYNFTKEKIETVVKERLIDTIIVNIDGHDEQSYFRVKRLPYKVVEHNILEFLRIRKEHNSVIKLQIVCLTFANYCNKIFKKFGKYPLITQQIVSKKDLIDDYEDIQKAWQYRINPKLDVLDQSNGVFGWAERKIVAELNHDSQKYSCPNIDRIKDECFIAPNGDWFACCFDETQKLVYGNIKNESLYDLYNSKKRKDFINNVEKHKYNKIGYPCIYIEGCQTIK